MPLIYFVTPAPADTLVNLRAACPGSILTVTGDIIPHRSLWRSVCHTDGTRCDWISDARESMSWVMGEILPQCCHGKDCIMELFEPNRPAIAVVPSCASEAER